MLRIPGQAGKDNCDKGVGPSRRDILQVGEALGSAKKCKLLHGNKNRVRALGFKNRLAVKRAGLQSRKLALAA